MADLAAYDLAGDGLPPGTVLGKYRVIGVIGRGGMGIVYLAEHIDLGMLRALKTLAPEWADHPLARARFLKEARAAARISHPHVVRIFDCGAHDEVPYFVMEYLDGEDLDATLRRTTLTVEQTAGIMLAVCAAISEMHQEGLIHRDLKPGNIFLARDKVGNIVPTVLDFGIVKPSAPGPTASATRTQDGVVVGTAHYVSPEQVSDLPAGERSDQYALGVVLYQCTTGRVPFDGESTLAIFRNIAKYQFVRPRDLHASLSREFEKVILKAMAERPADRFSSVYHLGRALLSFASPRHQALWNDYYDRVITPKAALSMPIPVAASSAWLPLPVPRVATALLPQAGTTLPLPLDETEPLARAGSTLPLPTKETTQPLMDLPIGGTQPLLVPASRMPVPDRKARAKRGNVASRSRLLAVGIPMVAAICSGLWLLWPSTSAPRHRKPLPAEGAVDRTATAEQAPEWTAVTPAVPVASTQEVIDSPAPSGPMGRGAAGGPKKAQKARPHRGSSRNSAGSASDNHDGPRSLDESNLPGGASTYPAVGRTSDSNYPAVE